MSKVFTTGLMTFAACALFACADGDAPADTSTTTENPTEPSPLSDDREQGPRTADDREQIASSNGASASAISYNHPEPHTLLIPALDLQSGRMHVYELSEGGGALGELHTHSLTLSGEQLSILRDGGEVSVESGAGGSKGAHTHTVTIARR